MTFTNEAKPWADIPFEQLSYTGLGAIVAFYAMKWVQTLVKRDAEERTELRAERAEIQNERRDDMHSMRQQIREIQQKNAELDTKWAECEAHRQHQAEDLKELSAELAIVKKHQADRLNRELP